MNIGFYSARSGLLGMQSGLDIISNNIANISTTGFKELRPAFSDLLYSTQKKQNPEAQTGHGVKMTHTDVMYKRGQLEFTNRALDFCTPTDGFFAVRGSDGDIRYTKDGAFYMSNNGDSWELVNGSGAKVLDYNGNTINVSMADDGSIDSEALMNNIGVYRFDNPYGLEADGANTYVSNAASGEGTADPSLVKIMCALERSSVDIGDQMVKVIQFQRAFQFNSKMVQTNDEIASIVNNLR